jgi:uncharacterized membrane protein
VTPERFRVLVSSVLIIGVAISATLLSVAFLASLAVGWDGSLVGAAERVRSDADFSNLVTSFSRGRPIAIAQLGLLVLVATPVVRVLASVVGFALEGDRLYASITLGVLAILLVSLLGLR